MPLEETWPRGRWYSHLASFLCLAELLEAESVIPVFSHDEPRQTECHPVREIWLPVCTPCSTREARLKAELALLELGPPCASRQPPRSATRVDVCPPNSSGSMITSLNCRGIFLFFFFFLRQIFAVCPSCAPPCQVRLFLYLLSIHLLALFVGNRILQRSQGEPGIHCVT